MRRRVRTVRTLEDWNALGVRLEDLHVLDVETYGLDPRNGKLLGLSLAPLEGTFADGSEAAYVVVQEHLFGRSEWRRVADDLLENAVQTFVRHAPLVGFNHAFDKAWVDLYFDADSLWTADARLMWHMSDASFVKKAYRLKDAQVEVLGWDARGDVELAAQVEARGSSLDEGGHYLADTDVLAYYAGLDAISTRELYHARREHFDRHQQWWLLRKMVEYSQLLRWNTEVGVAVDEVRLAAEVEKLKERFDAAVRSCRSVAEPWVERIEVRWRDEAADTYAPTPQGQAARERYLSHPDRWDRLSPTSSHDRVTLFYGEDGLNLPVAAFVKPRKDKKTGRRIKSKTPSSTPEDLALAVKKAGRQEELQPLVDAFFHLSHSQYLLKNFAQPMLGAVKGGRAHPNFNPCGTLSYRLSGSKPYFLNLPFSEPLMECFRCEEGFVGLHSDLVSVEPCVTAHYSQDPHLLKVFRDLKGDVYLDLALTLFPGDLALQQGYDPNAPVTSAVKKRFQLVRDVAKILQLAIAYTGTAWTVSQNLTKRGFPTTLDEAEALVDGYWRHYEAVRRMNERLFALNRRQGFLKNAVGRVIMSPAVDWKDLPNKFIQSSGHDALSMWVLRTYELLAENEVEVLPVILDVHDATTFQVPAHQADLAERLRDQALTEVNSWLGLSVPVRAEGKRFQTLFGLKNDEATLAEEGE